MTDLQRVQQLIAFSDEEGWGLPSGTSFLFLGDAVDRGDRTHEIECVKRLLDLHASRRVFLLAGTELSYGSINRTSDEMIPFSNTKNAVTTGFNALHSLDRETFMGRDMCLFERDLKHL
jgi:hypothetical protein